MDIVLLVVHIILALAIIGIVLLQPPENSSLGGLGGSNPMAAFGSRGQGNLLTRATAILATLFIITSLILAIMAGHKPKQNSIIDNMSAETEAPAMNDKADEAVKPDVPMEAPTKTPSVPLAK